MYKNVYSDTQFIELADGSRSNGRVPDGGDAFVNIFDANGKNQQEILTKALCILC